MEPQAEKIPANFAVPEQNLEGWQQGDSREAFESNVGRLAIREKELVFERLPSLQNYTYREGDFYGPDGDRIDPARREQVFAEAVSGLDPSFTTGAGSNTLGRALATAATQKAGTFGMGSLLPALAAPLKGILYSQAAGEPFDTVSPEQARAELGRAQPEEALVLTPTGWYQIGALMVGDEILDENGQAQTIQAIYPQGTLPIHRITTEAGRTVEASADHLWQTDQDGPEGSIMTTDRRRQGIRIRIAEIRSNVESCGPTCSRQKKLEDN